MDFESTLFLSENPNPNQPDKEKSLTLENLLATFLIDNGLGIFPLHSIESGKCTCRQTGCQSPGKHPFYRKSWKSILTVDETKIRKWISDPGVNIAVATGKPLSGESSEGNHFLVVIDVDANSHPIMDKLPKTFSYETGSGGHHFWYWHRFPLANSVSKLDTKVDIRGENGYVVVPPSRHISGKPYKIHEQAQKTIAPLPAWVIETLNSKNEKKSSLKKRTLPNSHGRPDGPLANVPGRDLSVAKTELWSSSSVGQLRSFLECGEKIPLGVRNNVIHRLLSSDRVKGMSENLLWENAKSYVEQSCEVEKYPISNFEIRAIISQVLKYKAYNTSHKNVHEAFFEFRARSRMGPVGRYEKETILLAESQFFDSLMEAKSLLSNAEGEEPREQWVSLQMVSDLRDKFFKERLVTSHSRYPLPLLAKKLESLGFSRRRTNQGNLWNVQIPKEINGLNEASKCAILKIKKSCPPREVMAPCLPWPQENVTNQRMMNMSTPTANPQIPQAGQVPTPSAANPAANPPAPPPAPTFEEKKVKVTVKKHPNEQRYCGRVNRDSSDAVMKLMGIISPEERQDLLAYNFMMDEEGTAEDFDAMQAGDHVGILLFTEEGWIPTRVEIERTENDIAYGKDLFVEEDISFAFEEVSAARMMGFFEILYRKDPADPSKLIPWGIEREREITLLIPTDPNAATGATPAQTASAAPQSPPVASATAQAPTAPVEPSTASEPVSEATETPSEGPRTFEELAASMPGASPDQIRATAEGLGIDIAPKGAPVPARGRGQHIGPIPESDSSSEDNSQDGNEP